MRSRTRTAGKKRVRDSTRRSTRRESSQSKRTRSLSSSPPPARVRSPVQRRWNPSPSPTAPTRRNRSPERRRRSNSRGAGSQHQPPTRATPERSGRDSRHDRGDPPSRDNPKKHKRRSPPPSPEVRPRRPPQDVSFEPEDTIPAVRATGSNGTQNNGRAERDTHGPRRGAETGSPRRLDGGERQARVSTPPPVKSSGKKTSTGKKAKLRGSLLSFGDDIEKEQRGGSSRAEFQVIVRLSQTIGSGVAASPQEVLQLVIAVWRQ